MPIHNDSAMLRQTINSVYALKPDEVLIALDRCTDESAKVIHRAQSKHWHRNTRCISYDEADGAGWRFRSAFIRRDLYRMSQNPVIINTSADLNLDPHIREYVKQIPHPYGLISFGYLDRWTLPTFLGRLHQILRNDGFGGLLAFSRDAWLRCEDLGDLSRVAQGEDDHLHHAIAKRYKTCNVVTRSIHLRPNTADVDQYLCGWDTRRHGEVTPVTLVYRSVLRLSPSFALGYKHACQTLEAGGNLDEYAERLVKRKRKQLSEN
jgi:glycosyltransferase involved in cell wall biosynthesis